jgi:hypothetical protein
MNHPCAPHRIHLARWNSHFRQLALLLATVTAMAINATGVSAQGLQVARNVDVDATKSRPRASPTALRVISTRSHMQCPLPGKNSRVLSIDSPREWEDTIEHQDERTALGRKVRWAKEQVLVYALESKPHAGARLESPSRMIRISQGILYWPVRQVMPETRTEKAAVLTRPCVMTTIDRAYWHRIKIVPTRP